MDGLSQLKGIVAYAVAGLLHWKKMNPSTGDNRQIRDGKRFADFFFNPLTPLWKEDCLYSLLKNVWNATSRRIAHSLDQVVLNISKLLLHCYPEVLVQKMGKWLVANPNLFFSSGRLVWSANKFARIRCYQTVLNASNGIHLII